MCRDSKKETMGCLFQILTFFSTIYGLGSIYEEEYLTAFPFCMPLISYVVYFILKHKYIRKPDRVFAGMLFGLITFAATFLGVSDFLDEDYLNKDYFNAYLLFLPLICCVLYGIYYLIVIVPEKKRQDALRKMYNYPSRLVGESGDGWAKAFLWNIRNGLFTVKDTDKRNDLKQCQAIVKKMDKEKAFDNLHHAFRLTGCHISITDADGHVITTID